MLRPATFGDPMLDRLYTAAELANLTVKQRQNYDNAMFTELDRIAQINFAKKAGMAEGREEGLAEGEERGRAIGREDERIKVAKAMKGKELDPELICELTGLSPEAIQAL